MAQFYRGSSARLILTPPNTNESSSELMAGLINSNENEDRIAEVLKRHQQLTAEQISDSLLELAFEPDYAFTALKAAKQLGLLPIARKAASVIQNAGYLSDEVKRLARECVGGHARVSQLGHGKIEGSKGGPIRTMRRK